VHGKRERGGKKREREARQKALKKGKREKREREND